MARMTRSQGLCPACGRDVTRAVTTYLGMTTETYHCPIDGQRSYGPHGLPVAEWVAPTMPTLRGMLPLEAAMDRLW